MIKRLTIVTRH